MPLSYAIKSHICPYVSFLLRCEMDRHNVGLTYAFLHRSTLIYINDRNICATLLYFYYSINISLNIDIFKV